MSSSAVKEQTMATACPTDRPLGSDSLVTTSISQQPPLDPEFHFYRRSVGTKHYNSGNSDITPPNRTALKLESFSNKSKSRLRFLAANATIPLISQLALTYHESWPTNGRECKKHLNAFLQYLRYNFPDIHYLWIMEFQTRNAPHFHLFLTVEPDNDTWKKLAAAWVRITGGTMEAEWWHGPKRGKNWISWDMGTAGYLAKYLDKDSQKVVPDGYYNFGRFWGNSRDLKPAPLAMPLETLDDLSVVDEETGEFYGGKTTVLRWLGRLAEKQTHGYSRFRHRSHSGSYRILDGMKGYIQIENYFSQLNERKNSHETSSYKDFVQKHDNTRRTRQDQSLPMPVLQTSGKASLQNDG